MFVVFLINQAHMALNDIDAAVESFKKALDLEPSDGWLQSLVLPFCLFKFSVFFL